MPELFPDFVVRREAFEQAKAFWTQLVSEELSASGQADEWTPWLQNDEWSGDPELVDGSVVFSLYSASQNKGLRVQQSSLAVQKDREPYVSCWTDVFGEGTLDSPVDNFFIGATPTDENVLLLRRLVRKWSEKIVDRQAMQQFIDAEL